MVHNYSTTSPSTLVQRLWTELQRQATDLGARTFRAGHRALAEALGCSPGSIPRLMQHLIDQGVVSRTPEKNRFLITVIDQSDPPEVVIDQSINPAPVEQASASAPPEAQPIDRSIPAMSHENHESMSESCTHTVKNPHQNALFWFLIEQPKVGYSAAIKVIQSGLGTLTDFLHDYERMKRDPKARDPLLLTIWLWIRGQRVPEIPASESPKEAPRHDNLETARRQPAARTIRTRQPIDHTPPGAEISPMRAFAVDW